MEYFLYFALGFLFFCGLLYGLIYIVKSRDGAEFLIPPCSSPVENHGVYDRICITRSGTDNNNS